MIYILNGDTTGNINAGASQGWFKTRQTPPAPDPRFGEIQLLPCVVSFQIVLAATGAPIGLFVFEVSNDVDPTVTAIMPPTALTLTTAAAAGQPTDGLARNVLFEFNPAPAAPWMRMRYARTSGGSAAAGAFMVGLSQRPLS